MNGGDLLLVGVVLVLGCAAFFVGILYMVCSFFALMGRGLATLFWPGHFAGRRLPTLPRFGGRCLNPKCGEVTARPARYCPHCGTRLQDAEL